MLDTKIKQPADRLDYVIDFARWLPDDDEILTVTTEVDPPYDEEAETGLKVDSARVDPLTHDLTVWLSGGENGSTYKVTATVATSGGRVKEVDFKIRIRDC